MNIFLLGPFASMKILLPINIWKYLFSHWVNIMSYIMYKKWNNKRKRAF